MELGGTDDLWVTSDPHLGHENIIKFANRPQNHEELILDNWRNLVKEDDTILHLGDVVWRKPKLDLFSDLPGKKYLIKGNHDSRITVGAFNKRGFTVIEPFVWKDYIAFTHRPITDLWPAPDNNTKWHINVHGHLHGGTSIHEDDGQPILGKWYVDMSVEAWNYKPATLQQIWNTIWNTAWEGS